MATAISTLSPLLSLLPPVQEKIYQAAYEEVVRLGTESNAPLAVAAANLINDKLNDALEVLRHRPVHNWLDEAAYKR